MREDAWEDNLDFRITKLEEWTEKHDASIERQISDSVEFRFHMQSLKESNLKQEEAVRKQNEKLERMGANINKMIVGVLATICLTLIKFFLDYILHLPK